MRVPLSQVRRRRHSSQPDLLAEARARVFRSPRCTPLRRAGHRAACTFTLRPWSGARLGLWCAVAPSGWHAARGRARARSGGSVRNAAGPLRAGARPPAPQGAGQGQFHAAARGARGAGGGAAHRQSSSRARGPASPRERTPGGRPSAPPAGLAARRTGRALQRLAPEAAAARAGAASSRRPDAAASGSEEPSVAVAGGRSTPLRREERHRAQARAAAWGSATRAHTGGVPQGSSATPACLCSVDAPRAEPHARCTLGAVAWRRRRGAGPCSLRAKTCACSTWH
jgi:hypothetical protein